MVSLRFPFWFPQPPKPPRRHFYATAAAVGAAATVAGYAASRNPKISQFPLLETALEFLFRNHSSSAWASLSLADDSAASVVDSKSGLSFPSVIGDSQQLLGIGMRRKAILGLKNINVYAFGIYANDNDIKESLREKYGNLTVSELQESKELEKDLMEGDISMTVRLQIVYGRLSIRSVRSAFEESVGNRLQKFGDSDNKELLHKFTSQFKDEYKIPRGSVIHLSRERGDVLRTFIDGKEVGSIHSQILCRSILDLYIGEDPFDKQAKDDMKQALSSILQN